MSLLTRALLLLAPRRQVRAAFTRHYERRDRLISERESVEDPRYADKSLGLWALS
jgi:hypothetical protein